MLIVHRKIYVPYTLVAVKVELPLVEALNVPVPPLTILHAPVPTVGVLPPRAPLTNAPQRFWVAPTVAAVGAS